ADRLGLKAGKLVSAPMNIYSITFDTQSLDEGTVLKTVGADPDVQVAQFNHYITLRSTVPNDPQYNQQWQYDNTGQSGGTPGADIDMDLAWDVTTGGLTPQGDTIVVCVIDDGIDAQHPDIAPNLWVNHAEIPNNGIDDDNNGFIDDVRGWDTGSDNDEVYDGGGHGTPVAGIVGARGDNGTGVAGVNWNVKLMIVQGGTGVESEVLEAYSYPLVMRQRYNATNGAEGAFVVSTNASWGIDNGQPSNAPLWCAFYDTLGVHGILNAGATANAALDVDTQGDLPTACPSEYLISVTNMDHTDQKVFQAAWGLVNVDLGAFGEGTHNVTLGGGYGPFGGTSGATPHVAGTIALLYAVPCSNLITLAKSDPGAAALLVRQVILSGVDPNPSLNGITVTGGRLNVNNSVEDLLQLCGPCPPPFQLEITGITDVQADFSWAIGDSADSVTLNWRPLGDSVWNTVSGLDSSYLLTGLMSCTTYEYELLSYCPNDTSETPNAGTFKTDGCCENPEDFALASRDELEAGFNWSSVLAAQSYEVRIRPEGGTWTSYPATSDTFLNVTGLSACTFYEAEIRLICTGGDTIDFGQLISFRTRGCGACIDGDYCAPPELSSGEEWIESFAFHSFLNESGDNGGYGNFTDSAAYSAELTLGDTVAFSLTPGFLASTYDEYTKIWIDYNQDGDFDDPGEEVFDQGSASANTVMDEFVVPATAMLGATRMRVYMQFDEAPDPCDDPLDAFGEVEDYCLTIVAPVVPCDPPASMDTLAITDSTLKVSWDAVNHASNYLVQYRKLNAQDWESAQASMDSMEIGSLDQCQEYEVRIASLCGQDSSSFTEADTFKTDCKVATSISKLPAGSVKAYPNPFNENLVVEINLPETQAALHIELFSAVGKQVYEQYLPAQGAQIHRMDIDAASLPAGMYWVRVRSTTGQQFAQSLLKTR
ncbi:MAG: S8 family serine peptidase, partial [Bacteroidota bacterium]